MKKLIDHELVTAIIGTSKRKTIVTVNRGVIDRNRKRGEDKPPVRAARGKYGMVQYGHVIKLDTVPPVYFVHAQNSPLPHGARVWVETEARAIVVR
jgi:hypothetical protein